MALRLSEGLGVTRLHACRCLLLCAAEPAGTSVFDLGHKSSDDQRGRDDCRSAPVGKAADVAEPKANHGNYTEPDDEVLWRKTPAAAVY